MTLSLIAPENLRDEVPVPTEEVWLPLRAAIVDIWEYEEQVFQFHCGRLILRGANESGKTKALELLLPFLLDASTQPSRLDPFGGSGRTMRWNLMSPIEDRTDQKQRCGVAWLEFGLFDGGRPCYFTIGARIRATKSTDDITIHYFAIDGRRIGPDISVTTPSADGRPRVLSVDDLREAIGESGEVFDDRTSGQRDRYRDLVDHRLFGLGRERYDGLIEVLLRLRRPKLSDKLDLAGVHDMLRDSLAPPDRAIVAQEAEALANLRQFRETVAGLRRAEARVGAFLAQSYVPYASAVVAAAGREVRSAFAAFDAGAASLRAAQSAATKAGQTRDRAQRRRDRIERWRAATAGRIRAHEESEEMRTAQRLRDLEAAADRTGAGATSAAGRLLVAIDRHVKARTELERREGLARAAETDLARALATTLAAATAAGLADLHEAAAAGLEADPVGVARDLRTTIERRRVAVNRLSATRLPCASWASGSTSAGPRQRPRAPRSARPRRPSAWPSAPSEPLSPRSPPSSAHGRRDATRSTLRRPPFSRSPTSSPRDDRSRPPSPTLPATLGPRCTPCGPRSRGGSTPRRPCGRRCGASSTSSKAAGSARSRRRRRALPTGGSRLVPRSMTSSTSRRR